MDSTDTLPVTPAFSVEKYALTTQSFGEPLTLTMKKYTNPGRHGFGASQCSAGVIIMMAHGLGFHKEAWEPVIEDLFSLENSTAQDSIIREVWALDCPNHGESYTMNEEVLVRVPDRSTIWDYADAFVELYKSGLLGVLDPSEHRIVLCGHSVGSIGVVLATSFFNPSYRIPFSALILVDPPIWSERWHGKENDVFRMMQQITPMRRDIWKTREAASAWLRDRVGNGWDSRVFSRYIEHGLRPLPTALYPDKTGVTLTTHRSSESSWFNEAEKLNIYEALYRLSQLCRYVPVHLIYGNRNDMFDRDLQDSLISELDGRSFASIRRIEGTGHLVPQEKPTELANEVYSIVKGMTPAPLFSKL